MGGPAIKNLVGAVDAKIWAHSTISDFLSRELPRRKKGFIVDFKFSPRQHIIECDFSVYDVSHDVTCFFKIHLADGLVQEAEKLLCQLICYTGEKKIRMKFIEGCVANLAANRYKRYVNN